MVDSCAFMGSVVFAMLVTACGGDDPEHDGTSDIPPPPPAQVTSMTPSSGPYGTEIVINGTGFGESAKLLDFTQIDGSVHQFSSSAWSDTVIRARLPFPVNGSGTVSFCGRDSSAIVQTPGCLPDEVRMTAGSFTLTSEWQPGRGQTFWGGVLAARVFSNGSVAAVSSGNETTKGPHLVVLGDQDSTPKPIPNLPDRPQRIVLFENADGRVEAAATSSSRQVIHHRWNADVFESVEIGVEGQVVAGGSDDLGRFVWISHEGGSSRLRVDDSWTVDRNVNGGMRSAAITADGTLIAAKTVRSGDLIVGYHYRLHVVSLAPDSDSFQDLGEVSPTSYEAFPWIDIEASSTGKVLLVSFCGDDGGSRKCDYRRMRNALGEWSNLPDLPDLSVVTAGENALAIAYPDERGIVVRQDFARPDQEIAIPVWPVNPIALLRGTKDFRVLVRKGFDVYAPHIMP